MGAVDVEYLYAERTWIALGMRELFPWRLVTAHRKDSQDYWMVIPVVSLVVSSEDPLVLLVDSDRQTRKDGTLGYCSEHSASPPMARDP
jgi:hypothetical protein